MSKRRVCKTCVAHELEIERLERLLVAEMQREVAGNQTLLDALKRLRGDNENLRGRMNKGVVSELRMALWDLAREYGYSYESWPIPTEDWVRDIDLFRSELRVIVDHMVREARGLQAEASDNRGAQYGER